MVPVNSLDLLRSQRPEWMPWLAVVDEVLRRIREPEWEAAVPEKPGSSIHAPLLANTTVTVDETEIRQLVHRLLDLASRCGTPKMSKLGRVLRGGLDPGWLLRASLAQDARAVAGVAESNQVDAEALQAVVALVAMPLLHACHRRWSSLISPGWSEGHCPVCASWPAFAEIRGIDRTRYLRCGRCGAEWHGQVLQCAYCRNTDHEQMTSLVPGQPGVRGTIEACLRCRGHVKAFTKLLGTPPAAVMLEDLASVDLDIAALQQGYARPSGAARELAVSVDVKKSGRRLFAWNT